MSADYDVVIVGGGLVGATLACALSDQDLRIALIETIPFTSDLQPSFDDRSIALAYGSARILKSIGLWQSLAPHATAIHKIHISDQGHFGFTRLNRNDSGHDALGYVIENRAIGNVFAARLNQQDNIDLLCPAQLQSLQIDALRVQMTLHQNNHNKHISARLVIGADGGQSTVRRLCNINSRQWDYGQSAIIANISTEIPHMNTAYERFTRSGPLAMLPLSEQRCAMVWTVLNKDLAMLLALDDDAFLKKLQQCFGQRLGTFTRCGQRSHYPLTLMRATQHKTSRVALIGNAAHTLHPIAGQGFNLGLRDVAALAEVITDARHLRRDIGSAAVLNQYTQWRDRDQQQTTVLTDSLVRIFSNTFTPLVIARNAALLAMDIFPPLKRRLAKQAMGLSGRLPRLARGLPL